MLINSKIWRWMIRECRYCGKKHNIQQEIKQISYCSAMQSRLCWCEYLGECIAYFCESFTEDVALSDEHQAFLWANKEECIERLPKEIIADFEKNKIFDYMEKIG